MLFQLDASIDILQRTPTVLGAWLTGLPAEWINTNEGGDSWSPYSIVGHLIHGEKTDWLPRLRIILSAGEQQPFEPFDRFAILQQDQSIPIEKLLQEFSTLRKQNLTVLKNLQLSKADLNRRGKHPALGTVTVANLLSSWVVHDLSHLSQISRVMAFQYKEAVGPWVAYMGIYK